MNSTYLALDLPNSTLPQSAVALAAAIALFAASCAHRRELRARIGTVALLGLLIGMLAVPLTTPAPMGDYNDFVNEGRADFEARFVEAVQFQFHLGGAVVRGLDALLGHPHPSRTFDFLAGVASIALVLGLMALGFWQRWSPQVMRYIALVAALPVTILYFGYHEFGHLSMAFVAPAIPLALIGIERGSWRLVIAGSGLIGVGAALHGFGLPALGLLWLIVLLSLMSFGRKGPAEAIDDRVWKGSQVVAAGLLGWLVWFGLYGVVLGVDVQAGHAGNTPLRPLFTESIENFRINYPIFSGKVVTDLAYEFGVVGAALLVLVPLTGSRLAPRVLLASIPIVLFVVVFWPLQGLGNDTDFLGAAFPAFFACAWLVASSVRLAAVAGGLLVLGHLAFLRILTTGQFVESQIN